MPTTVLVVDDNTLLRDVVTLALDHNGYVTTISSGADAAAVAHAACPGVILLDLGLPDVDGREVCRQIRANAHTAHIPIIAMTGSSIPVGLAVDDLLAKPFSMQMLLHKVEKWAQTPLKTPDHDLVPSMDMDMNMDMELDTAGHLLSHTAR